MGYSTPDGATIWNGGTPTALATGTFASGINNAGQVVGYSSDASGHIHATLWDAGTPTALANLSGTTDSWAHAINDGGQVVGYNSDGANDYATLWDSGTVIDLNTLVDANGWTLVDALAINLGGQIAGMASFSERGFSVYSAFLLTPCEGDSCVPSDFRDPALPEPAALPLLVTGLGLMGWFAWRKKLKAAAGGFAAALS